jgi:predicted MFS family arabinose efflux permease
LRSKPSGYDVRATEIQTRRTKPSLRTSRPDRPRYRWLVLAVATAAQASTGFVILGLGALAGFFRQAFQLSAGQTGLIVSAASFLPLLAMLPVGYLLDRHGERLLVAGGALFLGAGAGAASLAPSYPVLLALLLVAGAGYTTSQPGGSKAVAAWFASRERGLAMGVRQTGLPAGGLLAAAILPPIAAALGWRAALAVAALGAGAGGLAFALAYRDPDPAGRPAPPPAWGQVRRLLRDARIRRVVCAGLALVSAQLVVIAYLMLFLHDEYEIPLTRAAWALLVTQAFGIAGRVILAAWSDRLRPASAEARMRPVRLALAAVLAVAVALPFLPSGTPLWAFLGIGAWIGFFGFGWYGPWVVHIVEIAPPAAVGLTLALAMTANQLAIVVAPPAYGFLVDASGRYAVGWWTLAGVLAAAALATRPAGRR